MTETELSAKLDALELAVTQLADHVFGKKGKPFPGAAAPFGKKADSDGDDDGD